MLLAGDIGGTNTRLALFSKETGPKIAIHQETFTNSDFSGLEKIVSCFFDKHCAKVDRACFGVAGPVADGRVAVTNLPWIIEETHLSQALGIKNVKLINDLEAIAGAIPFLNANDLDTINEGTREEGTSIALIAPGTGLGEAFLTWSGNHYQTHASEGGHTTFAPTNAIETDLLRFLQQKYSHVSFERVCSGIGIPNLYNFFKASKRFSAPSWLSQKLSEAEDPSPIIFNAALDQHQRSEICVAVLDLFISILGAEAGNLALKVLSKGGIYLGGGIVPRICNELKTGRFMQSFTNKGRLSSILADMPVHIILHPQAALLGAACQGFA